MYSETESPGRGAFGAIAEHDVPGARSPAVPDGDEIVESAPPAAPSLRTGRPTTADAPFLPGSIGKLYTATSSSCCRGRTSGSRHADRAYLPEFRVHDEQAAEIVTPGTWPSSTRSGFDGDDFTDTWNAANTMRWPSNVAGCADLPQIVRRG